MINVSNDYKQRITQPRTIDAKITYGNNTILIDNINSIKRSFNSTLFKTIAKQITIDSNTTIAKDTTINPQFGIYIDTSFEYVSLGSYKVKNSPNLNKDTNSYEITAYDKIVDSMVDYALTSTDITYPCTVRQLFVAIFTKLGWSTSGIPSTFVNSTSQIEEDVYSNVNFTYRDVLDELCTISCMFLIDVNGTPTLKQKTTTSETINEDFLSDKNVQIKNQVFFNSLVFSRASESDNIYRKDDTSITNNGLHEFKVKNLQILSLNWRDNFIDAMWNYIKTFTYYAYEVNTVGITYLEPIDTFTLSTFGSTYSTILLNSDLTISNGVNEKIYANEPIESETEYKYADTTDKRINQTYLIVDKQQGEINALVSRTETIEEELASPTSTKENKYFDLEDALDSPLIDFSLYGETQQDSTTGKNKCSSVTKPANANLKFFIDKPAQTFTISFTTNEALNGNSLYLEVDGTSYGNLGGITASANTRATKTYTLSNGNYQAIQSGTTIDLLLYKNGANFTIPTDAMVENGDQVSSYEPYTGGSPAPSPTYPFDIHNVSGDNTIEICGKNLFSSELEQGAYSTGDGKSLITSEKYVRTKNKIIVQPNTTYTLSLVASSFTGTFLYYKKDGTYIGASSNFNANKTFTTDNETYYINIDFYRNAGIVPSDITNTMLNEGNQASTYEAYTGNSQLISLGVENLFNINSSYDEANGVTISIDGNVLKQTNTNAYARSGWVINGLEANKKYMLSCNYSNASGSSIQIRAYKSDKSTLLSQTSGVTSTSGTFELLITPTESSCYLRFYSNTAGTSNNYVVSFSNIQLEKGSKKNSYSPYGASYIELNKISTYQDYIYKDNDRWFLHKEIGKIVLDGSEEWDIATATGFQAFVLNGAVNTGSLIGFSNYYKNFASSNWTYMGNNNFIVGRNNNQIIIRNDNISTTSDLETWLSTHNTLVYYVLATPTNTEITDTTLLEQLNNLMTLPLYKNMTHITLTPNDLQPTMKIEYYRDTSINANFVPKEDMTKYYTKVETNAQIQINNSSIQQSVAEMQTTLDSNGEVINTISNQVQTLQSSTNLQINAINTQLENGVEKLTNSLVKIDVNGINTSKEGETFNTQITNKTFEVKDGTNELAFMGYDENEQRTIARIPTLESEQATIGVHRTEIITRNGKKRTAGFYVGGGN